MASTADYIKIAEGIKSNEISSRQKIEQLSSEISGVTGSINSARGQIDSLEASISAEMSRPYETDSEGNTYGGPNYAAISSMRSEIGALQGEIEGLMAQRAQLEGKRDEERAHLQEILIEKSATLSEVQSKAQDAAASIAAAGGMVGAYSGIGSNLANAFQGAHSNLAQAAGILGGSVAGVSAGGGGGGASGGSAAGIRGVPSQTRNTAAGMTTNGHGGGGRSMSGSSNRSASGASRGMKTNGAAKRSGTAGNFSTSQTSATAGAAFGIGAGTAGAVTSANAGAPNAAKFTTSKTSAVGKSVKPVLERHLPSSSRGSWGGEKGNSTFTLFDDGEYAVDNNKTVMTGKEIRQKYGASSVRYNNGEPDFTPFVDANLGAIHLTQEIPYLRNGNKFEKGTFDIANEKAAMAWAMERDELSKEEAQARIKEYTSKVKEYMKENGITWHECGDLHTILPVPSAINKIFSHTGGISIKLERQAARNILRERIGDRKVRMSKGGRYTANSQEINTAVQAYKNELKQEKQRIKEFKVRQSDLFGFSSDDNKPRNELKSYKYQKTNIFDDTAPLIKGLEKTRHGFQDCYVMGKEAKMYDDPENRSMHKIIFNQGHAWEGAPDQTCGQCSCGTIINMLGLNIDEKRVVEYAVRHGLCTPEGFTSPDNWVKILRGVGGIEATAKRRVPLKDLASEVEKGKGVIIGVSATRFNRDMYGKPRWRKNDGHAIALISTVREKTTGKILQYVVVDSNNMDPVTAVHFVDAKVLEKAYKKFHSLSVVTEQILR